MQGRIDDGQVRALLRHQLGLDAQGFHLGDVVIVYFLVADDMKQALGLGLSLIHQHTVGIGGGADEAGHAVGGLRAQLGAVLAVHLVAVVLGGIVTGGDHHAGNGVQVTHRVGQNRHGAQRVEQVGGHALLAQYQRRIFGKLAGAAAAVVGNHHAAPGLVGVLQQILRQALGGAAHVIAVHAVHARAQHAAHARRAKGQLGIEPVLDFLFIPGNRLKILHCILVLRKVAQPLLIACMNVHG